MSVNAGSSPANQAAADDLARLAADPGASRAIEWRAIVHVVRPIGADLLATFAFYTVFAASGSIVLATILGMMSGTAQLAWTLAMGRRIPPIQTASLFLVIAVGVLAIVTHDPRYMLYKAALIYLAIGAAMLRPGWLSRYIPPVAAEYLPPAIITIFGHLWAALILGTGLMSLALTLTQPARTVALVMAIWAPTSKIMLLIGQYLVGRAIVRDAIRIAINRNRAAAGTSKT